MLDVRAVPAGDPPVYPRRRVNPECRQPIRRIGHLFWGDDVHGLLRYRTFTTLQVQQIVQMHHLPNVYFRWPATIKLAQIVVVLDQVLLKYRI